MHTKCYFVGSKALPRLSECSATSDMPTKQDSQRGVLEKGNQMEQPLKFK